MGKLTYMIWHCTDTPEGREVTKQDIEQWHLGPLPFIGGRVKYLGKTYVSRDKLPDHKIGGVPIYKLSGRGWDRLGYSEMFHLNGDKETITPYNDDNIVSNDEMTWGAVGINSKSRHFVYVGGMDNSKSRKPKDTLTDGQFITIQAYLKEQIYLHPKILIGGHCQFSTKACPSFNPVEKLRLMGIPEKNIYKTK